MFDKTNTLQIVHFYKYMTNIRNSNLNHNTLYQRNFHLIPSIVVSLSFFFLFSSRKNSCTYNQIKLYFLISKQRSYGHQNSLNWNQQLIILLWAFLSIHFCYIFGIIRNNTQVFLNDLMDFVSNVYWFVKFLFGWPKILHKCTFI